LVEVTILNNSGVARGGRGKLPPYGWTSKNYVICVFSLSWNFFVSHDKYIARPSSRATLIHRQYNRDWGTLYSRPPIDPYLTSALLQNPGGATAEQLHYTAQVCVDPSRITASTLPAAELWRRYQISIDVCCGLRQTAARG